MLRMSQGTILLSLAFTFGTMTAFAARAPVKARLDPHYYSNRAVQYSFADGHGSITGGSRTANASVSVTYGPPRGISPGMVVGDTWYDYQHNTRIPRMITWWAHNRSQAGSEPVPDDSGWVVPDDDTVQIHFAWMYLPGSEFVSRAYAYRSWTCDYENGNGYLSPLTIIQPADEYAGYVCIDVTDSNVAIVGGHEQVPPDPDYYSTTYWDAGPCYGFFTKRWATPNDACGNIGENIWPSIAYHDRGADSRTYVFSCESTEDIMQQFVLYVKTGFEETVSDMGSIFCVDTGSTISQMVAADQNGDRVGLAWTANRPHDGDADTASANDGVTGLGGGYDQMDNDVYYKINEHLGDGVFHTPYDGAAHFWRPRVNATKNVNGVDGFRPYGDLTCMFTSDHDFHIVYPARFWPADALTGGDAGLYRNNIFHYSDALPYVRLVHDANWDQTTCNGGAWSLNAHVPSITECKGRLYVIFVQYNDIPGGIEDDCAEWGHPDGGGDPTGSANAEIWMTVSVDGGITWDVARNLTNTYTPRCGPGAPYGPCDADGWPSAAEFGFHHPACNAPAEVVIDPSVPPDSPYTGNWYFDLQYINDGDAGGISKEEGSWTQNEVKWARVPCVEPIAEPIILVEPFEIDFPAYTHHCTQLDTSLIVINGGNVTLLYTIGQEEDPGPYSGWLQSSSCDGEIPPGLNNRDTCTVSLNVGGLVCEPGTIVNLAGRLIFNSNAATSPDTLPIDFWVADTIWPPTWDTIYVTNTPDTDTCTALIVGHNGNFGRQGMGKVNMDYYNYGDCDNDENSPIEGDSRVYIYDGSPIVGWLENEGQDTMMFWSMFDNGWLSDNSYRPVGLHIPVVDCEGEFEMFSSGVFLTADSSIGLRKFWFAPHLDDADFVVQCLEVWSFDGEDHPGMTIGEGVDFDIPSDTAVDNDDGFMPLKQIIYQQGVDLSYAPHTDDSMFCQRNSDRYGGLQYLHAIRNDTVITDIAYGAYVAENDSFVYNNPNGFEAGELWQNMSHGGFRTSDSTEDLHTVMTYVHDHALASADTLSFWTVLATVMEGSYADLESQMDMASLWYESMAEPLHDADGNGVPDGCAWSDYGLIQPFDGACVQSNCPYTVRWGTGPLYPHVAVIWYTTDGSNWESSPLTDIQIEDGEASAIWEVDSGLCTFPGQAQAYLEVNGVSSDTVSIVFWLFSDLDGDCEPGFNIVSLTTLVAHLFGGGWVYCPERFDLNCDGAVNIVDLTLLVCHLFGGCPLPFCCLPQ